jgi:tRNA modification GTPase
LLIKPDIIAAIATPPGRGGVGIVRISGKSLTSLAQAILGGLPEPRKAQLSRFLDIEGQVIDQGIALYFPAPHSYTGEDVLELQGHGGPAIMNLLLSQCLACGARLAEPGEFTLRAYLNNKIDLVQAESVSNLIQASTSEAARCAVRSLQGHFSCAINELVQSLTTLRMLIEATLDFPEEEIEGLYNTEIHARLDAINEQLARVMSSAVRGNLLQEGIKAVLVGEPNVGKSSLLNQLAEDDVAIVTEIPGTTRDSIQRTITIAGVPIHVTDTAGLRETTDVVEQKGIERTQAAVRNADILIHLIDGSNPVAGDTSKVILTAFSIDKPHITVINKIDLLHAQPRIETSNHHAEIYLSARTGAGIEMLREQILKTAGWQTNQTEEGLFMARQRHLESLHTAQQHINAAWAYSESESNWELLAEELRIAQEALSSITGRFTADDLLGKIFSEFCIGK